MQKTSKHQCMRCGKDCKRKSTLISHLQRKTVCPSTLKNCSRSKLLTKCLKGGDLNDNFGKIICLGEFGGVAAGNLSCYLLQIGLGNDGKPEYLCLDGGSPIDGLWKYNSQKENKGKEISLQQIKGYLVSHCHLDHVAGLAIMTPATFGWAEPPALIASKTALKEMEENIFNDVLWPKILWNNFKRMPLFGFQYTQNSMNASESAKLRNVSVSMDHVFHGNKEKGSSVFYITDTVSNKTVVYFGDVTSVEHMSMTPKQQARVQLDRAWNRIASMDVSSIFIECAFSNAYSMLFGHLNPKLLKDEIEIYLRLRNKENNNTHNTNPFTLFVTHMKPLPNGDEKDRTTIMSEVTQSLQQYPFITVQFLRQGESFPAQVKQTNSTTQAN